MGMQQSHNTTKLVN